jgi:tetratricopeptide (TPR) repeat protein
MATNRGFVWGLLLVSATAGAREAASPSSCQSAAAQPAIIGAKSVLERNPADLAARFSLADAWSDAGCFTEAVQTLQNAPDPQSRNQELQTRLRVAKSLVGEEVYFEKLDRADAEAKLKRDTFRCSTLSDLDACSEAVRIKPEDAALLIEYADALVRAKRAGEAISRYRRAAALAPNQADIATKLSAAEAQVRASQASIAAPSTAPLARTRTAAESSARVARARATDTTVRQYSNAEPASSSH